MFWQLKFNVFKYFLLRVSGKHILSEHSYQLNSEPVKNVSTHVDLGLMISSKLKSSPQIVSCNYKANRMFAFLQGNCTQMTNIRCRRLLYFALANDSEVWLRKTQYTILFSWKVTRDDQLNSLWKITSHLRQRAAWTTIIQVGTLRDWWDFTELV